MSDKITSPSLPISLAVIAFGTAFAILFLGAENEYLIGSLLVFVTLAVIVSSKFHILDRMYATFAVHEVLMQAAIVVATLLLVAWFYDDHFSLLMITAAMVYAIAAIGLNIQFGYAGVLNFAGAAFLGIGCYTSAVLGQHTDLPSLLIICLGGLVSAVIGTILILPVLRTSGHYAALVTIAFSILFKTFLEVNDVLGGPQGLNVKPTVLFGWNFNTNIEIGDEFEASFYLCYVLLGLLLLGLAFLFTRRLERSWIGLSLDSIRLDETASACYGLNIALWKSVAFTLGNFLIGVAGAMYGQMLGYIAPSNFTFGDSLILVSIVLLGGIGNPWGVITAAAIVILLPEKFQIIQEYRFLLYGIVVIFILLYRPKGLLPRQLRNYLPGGMKA